jgi:transcriptional regulator with XRE-family HTH domain
MNHAFSRRVRDLREDMDMSQKEMAFKIPMHQSNYSKIERGLQEPNLFQLKRIAEILHNSVDDLLGIDSTTFNKEKTEKFKEELNNLYDKFFS